MARERSILCAAHRLSVCSGNPGYYVAALETKSVRVSSGATHRVSLLELTEKSIVTYVKCRHLANLSRTTVADQTLGLDDNALAGLWILTCVHNTSLHIIVDLL